MPGPALLLAASLAAVPFLVDPNFVAQTLYQGHGMISVDFGPNGRLYVAEKVGRILTFAPDGNGEFYEPTQLADLRSEIDADAESGLLGLIVDQDFARTRYMFLFYTTLTGQKVVRIEVNETFDRMVAGSETVLLEINARVGPYHKAGDLQFNPLDPEGLYLAIGEDSRGAGSQDPSIYPGKILRFSKIDGLGFTDNPFSDGDRASVESRVWAVGFRNPFRFAIHPDGLAGDAIYVSENGASTDRFSWVKRGSNGAYDPMNMDLFLSPPDPNFRILGTTAPFLCGIAVARGGPFGDPANPDASVLYLANPADAMMTGAIHRYLLAGEDLSQAVPLERDNQLPFATGVAAMDLAIGPDGAMYATQTNTGPSLEEWYSLTRIKYIPGHAPDARIDAQPTPLRGEAPFTVNFGDGSTDFDGYIASWAWDFGDGETSTIQNPTHLYQRPGSYAALLTVTDDDGLVDSAAVSVTVVSSKTLTLRGTLRDGRTLEGAPFAEPTELRVYAGDTRTLLAGPFVVPAGGVFLETMELEQSSEDVVVTAGENTPGVVPRYYGFKIPTAARTHDETLELYLSNAAIRGRIHDTRLEPARTDLGIARGRVDSLYTFAGGRDYLTTSGIPPTGIAHRTTSDVLGFYYVPILSADAVPGTMFFGGVVGDTGANIYFPASFQAALDAQGLAVHDVTLGLQSGGASCDDLSREMPVSNIDYATQIQPIWNNDCVGCHDAGSDNSGGLNLKTESWSHLVGVMSREVPGKKLIEPGAPERSFLFEKVSCASPQIGTRMQPTGDNLSAEVLVLIETWIKEGALPARATPLADAGISDSGQPDSVEVVPPRTFFEEERGEPDTVCSCTSAHRGKSSSVFGALLALSGLVVLLCLGRRMPLRNPGTQERTNFRVASRLARAGSRVGERARRSRSAR